MAVHTPPDITPASGVMVPPPETHIHVYKNNLPLILNRGDMAVHTPPDITPASGVMVPPPETHIHVNKEPHLRHF